MASRVALIENQERDIWLKGAVVRLSEELLGSWKAAARSAATHRDFRGPTLTRQHDWEFAMPNETLRETTVAVQHVKIALAQSFERAREAFESILPRFDAEIMVLLRNGEVERARQQLERGPELAILHSRDHGSVLKIAGLARKVLQYDVGNPLTASKMTRHHLAAAIYAPFRVVLYENEQGHAVFEYDKPATLFGQFADERVTMVALELDAAIGRAIQRVANGA
jgi:uncharacterized protein (DUF302 family)